MNRAELQKMARERLRDAKVLIDGRRWEFAYHTAGFAVECALKSCILARMIYTAWIFEEKWDAKSCRTHALRDLIDLAGLADQLSSALKASAASGGEFAAAWDVAVRWTVASRYEAKTEAEARELYAAIANKRHGVLQWIRDYW